MASRDLLDLKPAVRAQAEKFLQRSRDAGHDFLIYCTYRPLSEQARLYRQGRQIERIQAKAAQLDETFGRPDLAEKLIAVGPQQGRIVTGAAPGESLHNYGLAFDGVPLISGKPSWGTREPDSRALWMVYGEMGEGAGMRWAGRWKSFLEFPHLQARGANWRDLIKGATQ
jgi:peptidoglycan L-alanyl-D-glutamate endopeptidase CwlK